MKPKKAKKQRKNVHCTFPISAEASAALSHALLFMLNLKDFSFENEKISPASADEAESKLFDGITTLTRGEVRATSKAIDIVLSLAPGGFSDYSYIDDEIPGLLSDIEREIPLFEMLSPVLQQAVKDLKKL